MDEERRRQYAKRVAGRAADLRAALQRAEEQQGELPFPTDELVDQLDLLERLDTPADLHDIQAVVKRSRGILVEAQTANLNPDGDAELFEVESKLLLLVGEIAFVADREDAAYREVGPDDPGEMAVPTTAQAKDVQKQIAAHQADDNRFRDVVRLLAAAGTSAGFTAVGAAPTEPLAWAASAALLSANVAAELNKKKLSKEWLDALIQRLRKVIAEFGHAIDRREDVLRQIDGLVEKARDAASKGSRTLGKTRALWRRVFRVRRSRTGEQPADPWPPGKVFRDVDAPWCPEMVVIPGGTFLMGSPKNEPERYDDEGPQHEVRVPRFALGICAVTFAEYDHFREATGREKPEDQGWGRASRPVTNVSWEEANSYCEWLSRETGCAYRLPSEAEWEYACRAGTTTPFWWGGTITPAQANYDGTVAYNDGETGEYRGQTVPVRSFDPNPFGLYQIHGNVDEWVHDDWHRNYEGAPTDGSAWLGGDRAKVLRGGSWGFIPKYLRSAFRYWDNSVNRSNGIGFRVSRTLTP